MCVSQKVDVPYSTGHLVTRGTHYGDAYLPDEVDFLAHGRRLTYSRYGTGVRLYRHDRSA